MRRRSDVVDDAPETSFRVPVDLVNERVVLAAAVRGGDEVRDRLLSRVRPEHFFDDVHRSVWWALGEMQKRKLTYTPDALQSLVGTRVKPGYLDSLTADVDNVEHHVESLHWDSRRSTVAKGPLSALLEAFVEPTTAPERVRALARQVADGLEGFTGRHFVYDSKSLVVDAMAEVRRRMEGQACWPYGIPGLDFYDKPDGFTGTKRRRMIPGVAPGQMTFVTGVSGSGKSTVTAHIAIGQARQARRVAYGAWELQAKMTLELLACISLGWSRTDLLDPEGALKKGALLTHEKLVELEETMHALSEHITFIRNPFRRVRGEKRSNDANLDLIQGILSDVGCEVFIADMWRRALVSNRPDEEEEALFRQQSMLEEMGIHGIFVHQQRHKDMTRQDRRPTGEGLKGSGAYFETADNVIGIHRAAMWKDIEDDELEVIILKKRYGKGAEAVSFEWNPDTGGLRGGKSVPFNFQEQNNAAEVGGFRPVVGREAQGSMRKKK